VTTVAVMWLASDLSSYRTYKSVLCTLVSGSHQPLYLCSAPVRERSITISLSVCLSTSISLEPLDWSSQNSLCRSPVVVARFCSGCIAMYFVLPVLWMTSRLAVMAPYGNAPKCQCINAVCNSLFTRTRQNCFALSVLAVWTRYTFSLLYKPVKGI